MNSSKRNSLLTTAAAIAAATLIGAAGGCAGGGKHTSQGSSMAAMRMAQIKSATEWDMANQAFLAGDFKKAIRHIDVSLQMNPQVVRSHILRGRIQIEMGSLDSALESLQMAEALDPTSVDAHYYQGIVFERVLRRDRALEKYMIAAELDPTSAQYPIAVAEVMVDLGRPGDAETYLAERGSRFEHNAGVKQTLGHLAMMAGDIERGVELFNQARLLAPDAQGIIEDLVRAQIETRRYAEAEFQLASMLERPENKDRRDLMHLRAHCLMQVDRPLDARALLLELTEGAAGQSDVQAWVGLGTVAVQLRDFNRVRRAASRVQAIAPNRPEGFLLQAIWQSRANNPEQAVRSTAEALRRDRTNMNALTLHAALLTRLERYDLAAKTIDYARSIDPNNRAIAAVALALASRQDGGFASVPTD